MTTTKEKEMSAPKPELTPELARQFPIYFCEKAIATQENRNGDCAAHLAEARVFACPYECVGDAMTKCVDFQRKKSLGA